MMRSSLSLGIALLTCAPVSGCAHAAVLTAPTVPAAGPLVSMSRDADNLAPGTVTQAAPLERTFVTDAAGEGLLDVACYAPGCDWQLKGRTSALVRIELDGKFNQDLIVYQGAPEHTYHLMLGALTPGSHTLRFERNGASPAALPQITLAAGSTSVVTPESPQYDALAHAPIMIARPEAPSSDTPLLVFYSQEPQADGHLVTRYTPVFSNEDKGTGTRALMARWGRTVDIDWDYALERDGSGKKVRETYQGRLHITHDFGGKYENAHPILRDSTDNNNFDDNLGDGGLCIRLAPSYQWDPQTQTREEAVDANPWIYPLMAKELFREGKARQDGALEWPWSDDTIGDPRHFLFVEFRQDNQGDGLGVAVKLKNYTQTFLSSRGSNSLTASRSGWCRVAVELPRAVTQDDLTQLDVVGVGGGSATLTDVKRAMVLDSHYQPVFLPISWHGAAKLDGQHEAVTVYTAASRH